MSFSVSLPESFAGGKGDAERLWLIEMAETGIRAYELFDEPLRSPQSGKVGTAPMDIHRSEIHTVDIDKREDDVPVLILVPQNVAG